MSLRGNSRRLKLKERNVSTRASRKELRDQRRARKECIFCGTPCKGVLCLKCKKQQREYRLKKWDNSDVPKQRVMTCSSCQRKGHNVRTCNFRRKNKL